MLGVAVQLRKRSKRGYDRVKEEVARGAVEYGVGAAGVFEEELELLGVLLVPLISLR